jgi:large subunit ribosomal protein L9
MQSLSEKISNSWIAFPCKAGETGKLYGSITTQMIADAISAKIGATIDKRQIDAQPIRTLGEHKVSVRLTVDVIPSSPLSRIAKVKKPVVEETTEA